MLENNLYDTSRGRGPPKQLNKSCVKYSSIFLLKKLSSLNTRMLIRYKETKISNKPTKVGFVNNVFLKIKNNKDKGAVVWLALITKQTNHQIFWNPKTIGTRHPYYMSGNVYLRQTVTPYYPTYIYQSTTLKNMPIVLC